MDYQKKEDGGESGGIRRPSIDIAGGTVEPKLLKMPSGRVPAITYTRKFAAGGKVKSASKRADGIAQRGKTRGKMV